MQIQLRAMAVRNLPELISLKTVRDAQMANDLRFGKNFG